MRFVITESILLLAGFSALGGTSEKGGIKGEKVSYRSGKETVHALWYRPTGKGPFPGVVIMHGDFGLTEWVKKQGQRLAGKGFAILTIDLYRGEIPKNVEEAHILERGLPEDRVADDVKAAVDFLLNRQETRKESLAILGWDMGGGHALEGAIRDRRLKAAVVCYGRVPTDASSLSTLESSVLGIFAGKDEGIPPTTLDQFRAAMKKAGKRLAGLHIYPNCGNGFMDPASPYASGPPATAAIQDAWKKIEEYLARELK